MLKSWVEPGISVSKEVPQDFFPHVKNDSIISEEVIKSPLVIMISKERMVNIFDWRSMS